MNQIKWALIYFLCYPLTIAPILLYFLGNTMLFRVVGIILFFVIGYYGYMLILYLESKKEFQKMIKNINKLLDLTPKETILKEMNVFISKGSKYLMRLSKKFEKEDIIKVFKILDELLNTNPIDADFYQKVQKMNYNFDNAYEILASNIYTKYFELKGNNIEFEIPDDEPIIEDFERKKDFYIWCYPELVSTFFTHVVSNKIEMLKNHFITTNIKLTIDDEILLFSTLEHINKTFINYINTNLIDDVDNESREIHFRLIPSITFILCSVLINLQNELIIDLDCSIEEQKEVSQFLFFLKHYSLFWEEKTEFSELGKEKIIEKVKECILYVNLKPDLKDSIIDYLETYLAKPISLIDLKNILDLEDIQGDIIEYLSKLCLKIVFGNLIKEN